VDGLPTGAYVDLEEVRDFRVVSPITLPTAGRKKRQLDLMIGTSLRYEYITRYTDRWHQVSSAVRVLRVVDGPDAGALVVHQETLWERDEGRVVDGEFPPPGLEAVDIPHELREP
jgi:hypothetical protein